MDFKPKNKAAAIEEIYCIVKEKKVNLIDASLIYCEKYGLNEDQVGSIILSNTQVISKIKSYAKKMSLLK